MHWSETDLARIVQQPGYRVVNTSAASSLYVTLRPETPFPGHQAAPPPPNPRAPYRSRTEQRFADVLARWQHEGSVRQWWYEPCKGLHLAPRTSYTPDFLAEPGPLARWEGPENTSSRLLFFEVQGAYKREKDFQKLKMAAARYPCWRFIRATWDSRTWHYQEIPSA